MTEEIIEEKNNKIKNLENTKDRLLECIQVRNNELAELEGWKRDVLFFISSYRMGGLESVQADDYPFFYDNGFEELCELFESGEEGRTGGDENTTIGGKNEISKEDMKQHINELKTLLSDPPKIGNALYGIRMCACFGAKEYWVFTDDGARMFVTPYISDAKKLSSEILEKVVLHSLEYPVVRRVEVTELLKQ